MNDTQLRTKIKAHLKLDTNEFELVELHAHASYRSYHRVRLPDGRSYVVMAIPAGKWSVSEEISNSDVTIDELPFLNVTRYLQARNFPVASIVAASERDGVIILQDLGDRLLENEIKGKPLEAKVSLYKQAVALLVDLQNKTDNPGDCVAFQRHFNDKLLRWELDHFFEYGIERRLNTVIDTDDKTFFDASAAKIVDSVLQQPQVFVHRDYQSRNLMIHSDRLWLIDFQDALIGPVTYDLVALLRDSYIVLDRRLRESLIDEFLHLQADRYGQQYDRQQFSHMFDWMTIQRKLKDAGRFVFIAQEKGNPNFMPYIGDTLGYVKEALLRQTELKEFYERLKKYVPEWQS